MSVHFVDANESLILHIPKLASLQASIVLVP